MKRYEKKVVRQPRGPMIMSALGQFKADLVLKNANVLNVFTKEFMPRDVAINGDTIIGIGEYQGALEYDFSGRYIVPGFIDAHVHIESSMLIPQAFAREVVCRGTTTLIADPHEIANVCGEPGIQFMLDAAEEAPVNLYYMMPSCVPAGDFDTSGAVLDAAALAKYVKHPAVLGLGEVMNSAGIMRCDSELYRKLALYHGKMIDGHAPMMYGKMLQTYRLAGVMTDHESTSGEEAAEKLRAGLAVLIREGSGARNLDSLIQILIDGRMRTERVAFCTDDKHVDDIRREGHIDHHIRRSIELGLDPVTAYLMASWYPAQIYGLRHLGAVAAGYQADLVVLNNLYDVKPEMVLHKGAVVRSILEKPLEVQIPPAVCNTVHAAPVKRCDLRLKLTKDVVPVIVPVPGQIMTKRLDERVRSRNGYFIPGACHQKVAVIERHHASGNVGLGIVRGFIKSGAIAATVGHDAHNMIVIGTNDADMLVAIQAMSESGGGYVIVKEQKIIAGIELEIAGLMSTHSADELCRQLALFSKAAQEIGVSQDMDPYQTLSFLPLPVLPELRVTDKGLLDAASGMFLSY